ncbi:MAG: hypothetical protein K0R63_299 [Rickettsiales bacterium]|nr:hypothetical protein [Rickettsiales bacterium]
MNDRTMKYSVKKQLMAMGMVTSCAILVMSLCVFFIYGAYSSRASLIKELTLVSNIIANRVAPALSWEDHEMAQESLDDLKVKSSISLACIYNKNKEIYAKYKTNTHSECPVTLKEIVGILKVTIYQDITFQDETEGYIYIESDLRDIADSIPTYLLFAFLLLLPSVVLAFLVSSKYQRNIILPITSLVKATERIIEDDDFSARAQKFLDDEIGQLADSFNFMMEEIDASHRQLEKITDQLRHTNANLERLVSERTRDLKFTIQRLEKANEDKNIWISNMTHEIRTPIHGMKSFSKFGVDSVKAAIEGKKEVDLQQYVSFFERCQQAANRLNYLIEGILDLSKMNAGKMNFRYQQCSMLDILRISHDELQHKWEPKNITVKFEPENPPEIELTCDKNKLIQVVTNVLCNAIKFTPNNSVITIHVEEKAHRYFNGVVESVDVSIKDRGPGIPPGEEEKIFDTFVQSSTTYDGSGGTGLGLSIAREIVRAHNGEIKAQNNPNGEPGCTFMFWVAKASFSKGQEGDSIGDAA